MPETSSGISLFPVFEAPELVTEETTPADAFKKSWLFDFKTGEFVITPTGKIATVDEYEAYKTWVYKTLLTERFRYLVYDHNYGVEIERIFRLQLPRSGYENEVQRTITEALMIDPRTKSVDSFTFSWDGGDLHVSCRVVPAFGESFVAEKVVNL